MKKKFLLPLIGVMSTTATALPLVGCGCSHNGTYEIYNKIELMSNYFGLQSDKIHFEKNIEIKFAVKWSKLKEMTDVEDAETGWRITAIAPIGSSELYAIIMDATKCHFYLNDKELKDGEILVDENPATTIYPSDCLNLQDNSVISGTIFVSKVVKGTEMVEIPSADLYLITIGAK